MMLTQCPDCGVYSDQSKPSPVCQNLGRPPKPRPLSPDQPLGPCEICGRVECQGLDQYGVCRPCVFCGGLECKGHGEIR